MSNVLVRYEILNLKAHFSGMSKIALITFPRFFTFVFVLYMLFQAFESPCTKWTNITFNTFGILFFKSFLPGFDISDFKSLQLIFTMFASNMSFNLSFVMVTGHSNPRLFNPKLHPQISQPQVFQPRPF